MDRAVGALRRFEARNPGGYGWRAVCRALGWSRSWFQEVLREHRLRSGQGASNTPALPLNGANQPWVYRNTGDIVSLEADVARFSLIALAYLATVRAFCMSIQNAYAQTGNVRMLRHYRRSVRHLTALMEDIRDLRDAS